MATQRNASDDADASVELPEIGTRVVLRHDFECFPEGIWAVGETGVVEISENEMIGLKLDTHYPALKEWDNCLMFYADGQTTAGMVEEFWGYTERAPENAPGM